MLASVWPKVSMKERISFTMSSTLRALPSLAAESAEDKVAELADAPEAPVGEPVELSAFTRLAIQ